MNSLLADHDEDPFRIPFTKEEKLALRDYFSQLSFDQGLNLVISAWRKGDKEKAIRLFTRLDDKPFLSSTLRQHINTLHMFGMKEQAWSLIEVHFLTFLHGIKTFKQLMYDIYMFKSLGHLEDAKLLFTVKKKLKTKMREGHVQVLYEYGMYDEAKELFYKLLPETIHFEIASITSLFHCEGLKAEAHKLFMATYEFSNPKDASSDVDSLLAASAREEAEILFRKHYPTKSFKRYASGPSMKRWFMMKY